MNLTDWPLVILTAAIVFSAGVMLGYCLGFIDHGKMQDGAKR